MMKRGRVLYAFIFFALLLMAGLFPYALAGHHGASTDTKPAHKQEMKGMGKMPMQMQMATEGVFEGMGKVIALVPAKSQIVVDHQEIPGFMKGMTMGYQVESMQLLEGLQPGDAIKFKIDAAKKKIVAIEAMR